MKVRLTDKNNSLIGDYDLPIHLSDVPVTPAHPTPTFTGTQNADTSTTLAWSAAGASGLFLQGIGVTGPSNSQIVRPAVDTTYTLRVTYPGEADTVLTVLAKAVVPPATKAPLIGVNVIFNGDDARNAIAAGCKFLSITFNPDLAWQLKQQHPELTVAARGNFYKGHLPSDAEVSDKLGPALHPGMIVYGCNENDQIGDQVADIVKRAQWDAAMLKRCQGLGVTYAGAGFAMGGPDITQANIRAALRDNYAPLVKAGMIWNQHTYSGNDGSGIPVKERIYRSNTWQVTWDGHTATIRQTWWLEEREKFYVAFCGFEPTIFINDETGVDDNPGGFKVHGYNDQEVADWCKRWIQINSEPIQVDGRTVPFHKIGGALFQAGDDQKWASYEVRQYFGILQSSGVWTP